MPESQREDSFGRKPDGQIVGIGEGCSLSHRNHTGIVPALKLVASLTFATWGALDTDAYRTTHFANAERATTMRTFSESGSLDPASQISGGPPFYAIEF